MKLATIFERKEIEALQPGVVVESWRYRGHGGLPVEHRCSIESYKFMQRVTHFFGTYE